MDKKKNLVIIVLLIAIVLMSVGYAALAQVLTINGTAKLQANWDVEITDVKLNTTQSVGVTTHTESSNATSATFDVTLDYPGAKAVYDVTVENKGTIDAILDSITDLATVNAAEPTNIVYTVSGVTAGTTTLAASATNTVTVTAEWVACSTEGCTDEIPEEDTSKDATIVLNYVQNTSTSSN